MPSTGGSRSTSRLASSRESDGLSTIARSWTRFPGALRDSDRERREADEQDDVGDQADAVTRRRGGGAERADDHEEGLPTRHGAAGEQADREEEDGDDEGEQADEHGDRFGTGAVALGEFHGLWAVQAGTDRQPENAAFNHEGKPSSAAAANATGSVALVPSRRPARTRVTPYAAATPTATPIPMRTRPWLRTMRSTSAGRAPSARRTAISRRRAMERASSIPATSTLAMTSTVAETASSTAKNARTGVATSAGRPVARATRALA